MAVTNSLCLLMAYTSIMIIFGAGCPEHNMQYCSNCKADSSVCINDVGLHPLELCELTCLTEPTCMLGEYNPHFGACFQHSCSQIEEDVTAGGYFTLRKVCLLSACLNYTLSTLHGQTGTCAILETQTGLASLVDCSMLCLDTDSCRGSTFYGNGTCLLHDCGNNTLGTSDATFIKRSCFGDTSHMNSLPTSTPSRGTTKHSQPSVLTTAMSSPAHILTVETTRVTMTTSSVPAGSAMTTFVDSTLSTAPTYKFYTLTPFTVSDASTAVVTQSANNADSFLDKPSNVASVASAGGIMVGAAAGWGIATKCQKRGMNS